MHLLDLVHPLDKILTMYSLQGVGRVIVTSCSTEVVYFVMVTQVKGVGERPKMMCKKIRLSFLLLLFIEFYVNSLPI